VITRVGEPGHRAVSQLGIEIPLGDKGNFIAESPLLYLPMTALW
jgi:hypothetical protein